MTNTLRLVLKDIQTGEFAKSFILENKAGALTLTAKCRLLAEHATEEAGEKLRCMMPWIKKNKLVDQSRNYFDSARVALEFIAARSVGCAALRRYFG